jgi:hypothetical protein
MATGIALSETGYDKLLKHIRQQERKLSNLERRLANVGVRRHEGFRTPIPRIRFRNDSSSVIPAYGVVRITGGSTQDFLTVDLVDATYRWLYLVNGPRPVAAGASTPAYGLGTFLTSQSFSPKYRRVSVSGATPAYGEKWGPVSGSTALGQHRPGFFILGGYDSNKNTVMALQQPPGEVRVKNDDGSGSFAAGGTGRTFGIYGGTDGTSDTGLEVTINNGSTTSWATNKYGWATADAGGAIWGAPHQT